MQGRNEERWRELCEQVIVEKDSQKLIKLVEEIVRLLDEKQARLSRKES